MQPLTPIGSLDETLTGLRADAFSLGLRLFLVVGLVVSIFQTVTQIQEQTLSFVPKLIVVGICLALFGTAILMLMVDFTQDIFARIPELTR